MTIEANGQNGQTGNHEKKQELILAAGTAAALIRSRIRCCTR